MQVSVAAKHQTMNTDEVATIDASQQPISVLLVDDHPLFRDAVKRVLDRHANIQVIAESGDGNEAVALAAELKPVVTILDIGLRGLNGLEVVRRIKTESPQTAVLVLTVHDDAEHVRSMLHGTAGYSRYP